MSCGGPRWRRSLRRPGRRHAARQQSERHLAGRPRQRHRQLRPRRDRRPMRTANILVLKRPRRRCRWVACVIAAVLAAAACGGGENAAESSDRGSDQRDLSEAPAMPADPPELSEAMDAAGALSGLLSSPSLSVSCCLAPGGDGGVLGLGCVVAWAGGGVRGDQRRARLPVRSAALRRGGLLGGIESLRRDGRSGGGVHIGERRIAANVRRAARGFRAVLGR